MGLRRPRPIDPMILDRIVPDTWLSVHAMLGLAEEERGLGHTTHQIENAPEGAFYVWCNEKTNYARDLARVLNRSDLQIMPAGWIWAARYTAHQKPIVIDHALNVGRIAT